MSNPHKYKRIMVVGDSGRGKSIFAHFLHKQTGLPLFAGDDYFWKVKYTERNDKEQSLIDISKVYQKPEWIMEGSSRALMIEGLEKADKIYYLEFKSLIAQYYYLIKREFGRENRFKPGFWGLLKHVTKLKYMKNYHTDIPRFHDLLKPHHHKLTTFHSLKQIKLFMREVESLQK
jgi:adenylate kinase family enzyme